MTHQNCLNCGKELTDKYCAGCGQNADTHRITFKNFIFHDLLHGIFHIERGILFTAKQALTQPGKAALDYISGKRKPYYNVFYLTLITIGLIIFIHHFYDKIYLLQGGEIDEKPEYLDDASRKLDELFSQKSKIIILLFVPLAALNSFILFKKKKLNFSEHSIITGMILLGMLLLSLFGNLVFFIDLFIPFGPTLSDIISWLVALLIIFFVAFGLYNAFESDYSNGKITLKILLFYALICLEIFILFLLAFGIISHWKFGTVHLSPFG